jgi:hypothetical protein
MIQALAAKAVASVLLPLFYVLLVLVGFAAVGLLVGVVRAVLFFVRSARRRKGASCSAG